MNPSPRYLLCLVPSINGLRREYTKISSDTEKKINVLYPAHKLPPKFLISSKEIDTDTILGFTDKALPDEPTMLPMRSWSELRTWVQQQEWYIKQSQATSAQVVPEISETQQLFP